MNDYRVKSISLKQLAGSTVPHLLGDLLAIDSDLIACTEWKPKSNLHMRRVIRAKQTGFDALFLNLAALALHGRGVPKSELPRKHEVEAHYDSLGQCMQEIENRGNYFGAFACTVLLIGNSLARVREAVSQVVKVFGRWDASLIEERLNLFSSWLSILPGNYRHTRRYQFERLFKERGLPQAIRSDNGVPFASPNGLFNLSRLSVWWLRLGISIERIRPGHPQQNGRHERMHLTLKKEATRPAGANLLQQQPKFEAFLEEFNQERPHEALDMKCPAEVYTPSSRPYRGIGDPQYPFHDKAVVVTNCGRLCLYRKKINLSTCLAGQAVGIKEVDDGIWLVSFMQYDLGYVDLEEKTLQPLENPFGPKVFPMS